jgi:hypothetical protein
VIISIYVSIFTALINLVVDFLFVDILFAPTMDSTKQLNKSLPSQTNEQSSSPHCDDAEQAHQTRKVEAPGAPPLTPVASSSAKQFNGVKRLTLLKIQSGNLDLETTRVLPSATLKAHALAKLSVNDIIDERVSVIKQTLLRHETQRRASSLRARSKAKSTRKGALNLNEMSVNDQFVDLAVDIAEQRKELRRSQQEKFDEMWG